MLSADDPGFEMGSRLLGSIVKEAALHLRRDCSR